MRAPLRRCEFDVNEEGGEGVVALSPTAIAGEGVCATLVEVERVVIVLRGKRVDE